MVEFKLSLAKQYRDADSNAQRRIYDDHWRTGVPSV